MNRPIKIDITTEHIQALLEGKKLTYNIVGQPQITLYPERYGVFMTLDKFHDLRRKVAMQLIGDPDKIFREAFGDEVFEKIVEMRDKPTY